MPSGDSRHQMRVRDAQGRDTLLLLNDESVRMPASVAAAIGRLQWLLPDKSLVEVVGVRLPDWPPEISAWRVQRKPVAPLTWPGHDEGPVARFDPPSRWLPWPIRPWAALA